MSLLELRLGDEELMEDLIKASINYSLAGEAMRQ